MKTSQIIQIVTLLAVIVITQPTSKAQGRGPGAMHADMRDTGVIQSGWKKVDFFEEKACTF